MRYVKLTDKARSPYEALIKYKCGPNFVLNRQNDFEEMIRSQGFKFWFRFWLVFSTRTNFNDKLRVDDEWQRAKTYAYINIHKQFLQGSVDTAIKFCFEKAISSLNLKTDKRNENEDIEQPSRQTFAKLLLQCSNMTFGAALCVVFYQWLNAKRIEESCNHYWTVPNKYLNSNYRPNLLEIYLAVYWESNLLYLLGINKKQIPRWLIKLLSAKSFKINDNSFSLKNDSNLYDSTVIYVMKVRRDYWKMKVDGVDEACRSTGKLRTVPFADFTIQVPEHQMRQFEVLEEQLLLKERAKRTRVRVSENLTPADKIQPCSHCGYARFKADFRICKPCLNEHWPNPKMYCCVTCQREDWFAKHSKDHKAEPPTGPITF